MTDENSVLVLLTGGGFLNGTRLISPTRQKSAGRVIQYIQTGEPIYVHKADYEARPDLFTRVTPAASFVPTLEPLYTPEPPIALESQEGLELPVVELANHDYNEFEGLPFEDEPSIEDDPENVAVSDQLKTLLAADHTTKARQRRQTKATPEDEQLPTD
jgi:hypothetical protein